MKKFFLTLFLLLFGFSIVACSNNPEDPEKPSDKPNDSDPLSGVSNKLIFHWAGDEKNFDHLWVWGKGLDGAEFPWEGKDIDSNNYATVDYTTFTVTEFGFIVVKGNWEAKDAGGDDRYVDLSAFTKDANGNYHVYLIEGDATIYQQPGVVVPRIKTFAITNKDDKYVIEVQTNCAFKDFTIKADDTSLLTMANVGANTNVISHSDTSVVFSLGTEFPDLTKTYTISMDFEYGNASTGMQNATLTAAANVSALYKTTDFASNYTYEGELGAIYSPTSTTFRVWSPVSSSVKLRIYETGTPVAVDKVNGSDEYEEYDMAKGDKGVFEYVLSGDQEGKYYTYVVTNGQFQNKEIVDPYAKSCGVNGRRGMVVDFSKTNPIGWESVNIHAYAPTQLTVWETHIADLTSSATWGGTPEYAKTYKGFYEEGTTYEQDGVVVATGFDHIKELGVNAVQIIPTFDSDNNEVKTTFNWGYNPLNYNALDGSYSTNPYDGYERIKEFKELVQAYNANGINIIMDVVYNHVMSAAGSNFDVLVPGYYYRYTTDGQLSNGSGCGNETASEMPMMRKFMIDSTEFWASEYKLGGFRFDLMGLHDIDTMSAIADNLHSNVNEAVVVYGEPWTGGTSPLASNKAATQANLSKYGDFGQFNDQMRDALIKGGMNGATALGWATNRTSISASDVTKIVNGIKGLTNTKVTDPTKSVQYVTCHDNYTLYDRFVATNKFKTDGVVDEEAIAKGALFANSVVFSSQGISFMLAGEEFLRTKGGNHNSYNASYKVNELDYSLKIKHHDMFESYKKLIEFRQKTGLFVKDADAIATDVVVTTNESKSMIVVRIHDTVDNKEYIVLLKNGVAKDDCGVDLSAYDLYLSTLGTEESTIKAGNYQVQTYETIIMSRAYDETAFNTEIEFITADAE